MKNLFDDYAKAVSTWAAHTSTNAIARSVTALDKMRKGEYTTELFTQQVYEYWRDLLDFRAQAAVGAIPSASLVISSWTAGGEPSNFVQVPARFWDKPKKRIAKELNIIIDAYKYRRARERIPFCKT